MLFPVFAATVQPPHTQCTNSIPPSHPLHIPVYLQITFPWKWVCISMEREWGWYGEFSWRLKARDRSNSGAEREQWGRPERVSGHFPAICLVSFSGIWKRSNRWPFVLWGPLSRMPYPSAIGRSLSTLGIFSFPASLLSLPTTSRRRPFYSHSFVLLLSFLTFLHCYCSCFS